MESTGRSSAAEELTVPEERAGQYARLEEIGRGGQSAVWLALDGFLGREVAVKELLPWRSVEPSGSRAASAALQRFLREARVTARLDHPSIVPIYELARRPNGALFCAQKLIRGETLKSRLSACKSLDERLALLPHLIDACQAIAYAHSRGVIHRDLKPSNIMVGAFGETVVVDWGLAKQRGQADDLLGPSVPAEAGVTTTGKALGTPAYMSPEQVSGDVGKIDERSDVFGLGVVLYELLTGRLPFEGDESSKVMQKVLRGDFKPVRQVCPEAPADLAAVAERAMQHQSAARYAGAEPLAKELEAYLTGGRVGAYRYGTWELLRKFAASHRALTAGLAVALAALVVSAVVVGFRLRAVHRDLSRSFVERAHAAERESDWALAAAYFAAARTQRDTPEARWGVALAEERAIQRVLSVQGPTGSFTDATALPDGRIVVLATVGNRIEVRELEGGKVLWSRDSELMNFARFLPGGTVRLTLPNGWAFFDAVSGSELGRIPIASGERPCPGPYPTTVTVQGKRLIGRREGQAPITLATDVTSWLPWCAVSDDSRQVAYVDTSGGVHLISVDDGRSLAQAAGTAVRALLFSSHGLVIIRQGWVDVIGGAGGDFRVALPEPAFGAQIGAGSLGGAGVSPDGNLVVVSRIGSTRADVVDLSARAVRGTLHFVAGEPRFAFSLDGSRVIAAGLNGDSRLEVWHLPANDAPTGHPGHWSFWSANFSPDGRQMAIIDASRSTLELYGDDGKGLASIPVPPTVRGGDLVRDGVVLLSDLWGENEVRLRDVEHNQDLWRHRCRACYRFQVSADGSRAAFFGTDGLEVWDAHVDRVLFTEKVRLAGQRTALSLSPDGRWIAWTEAAVAHVRELDAGQERTFQLDSPGTRVSFNPDSRRLAIITSGNLSIWDAAAGRALWTVPYVASENHFTPRWSVDAGALLVWDGLGTDVFDAHDGERLARFPANGAMASVIRPDLRVKLIASESSWDFRPLPQPASDSPAQSLARTLRRTGLALEGVEIVAAP
jgi:tRNA A-37 threonylcarbamoyl transferase component Bud32